MGVLPLLPCGNHSDSAEVVRDGLLASRRLTGHGHHGRIFHDLGVKTADPGFPMHPLCYPRWRESALIGLRLDVERRHRHAREQQCVHSNGARFSSNARHSLLGLTNINTLQVVWSKKTQAASRTGAPASQVCSPWRWLQALPWQNTPKAGALIRIACWRSPVRWAGRHGLSNGM